MEGQELEGSASRVSEEKDRSGEMADGYVLLDTDFLSYNLTNLEGKYKSHHVLLIVFWFLLEDSEKDGVFGQVLIRGTRKPVCV